MPSSEQEPTHDPVIEAYKRNVDRTLLVQSLRRTPEERLNAMVSMLELTTELREALRQKKPSR